jgi:hypothetical protein
MLRVADQYQKVAMSPPIVFADVLDAAEQLDPEAQAELVAVLTRRLAERGRDRVAESVAEARREFAAGDLHAARTTWS